MALDFDLTCTARLKVLDDEIEKLRLEAASGGVITREFSGPRPILEKKRMREGSF